MHRNKARKWHQTGTQGASQASAYQIRMQGAFSKAVEKEATFKRKDKARLTLEIVLTEGKGLGHGLAECSELKGRSR